MGRSQGDENLIVEESVLNKGGLVVVHEHLDNDADYLSDLMIDEALPPDLEFNPLFSISRTAKFQNISL